MDPKALNPKALNAKLESLGFRAKLRATTTLNANPLTRQFIPIYIYIHTHTYTLIPNPDAALALFG